jgi:hypothetical protein
MLISAFKTLISYTGRLILDAAIFILVSTIVDAIFKKKIAKNTDQEALKREEALDYIEEHYPNVYQTTMNHVY